MMYIRVIFVCLLIVGFVYLGFAQPYWPTQPQPYPYPYQYYPQYEQPRETRRTPRQAKRESTPRKKSPSSKRSTSKSENKSDSKSDKKSGDTTTTIESANPNFSTKPAKSSPRKWLKDAEENETAEETSTTATGTETAPPAEVSSQLSSDGYISYVWSNSDSLSNVAKLCDTTTKKLLEENNIRSSELEDGQVLRVPAPKGGVEQLDGTAFNAEAQRRREIWRGIRGSKRVALTFDAGGDPDGGEELLQALTEAKVGATFFVTGDFASKNSELVRRISDAGFPIHNHSSSHPDMRTIADDVIANELNRAEETIRNVTGRSTKPLWRPPYGESDPRILAAAASSGYQSVRWTLDSLDSVGEPKSVEFLVDRVTNPPRGDGNPEGWLDGAIILMHVGTRETAAAVPQIINRFRDMGFRLVSIDDLLKP